MNLQAPKGTRDFLPEAMLVREQVAETIKSVYKSFGFMPWDGPCFEYLETVTVKSGDEIKNEIYAFKDKAERDLALRFELTGSLARIVANNPQLKKPLRLWNIGKAWRYERPQSGRFREFFQSDTDIFGSSSMDCEVELIDLAVTALNKLKITEYEVIINNRKILNSLIRKAGISDELKPQALRALDKLAKIGTEGVREEFIARGIDTQAYQKLMNFFQLDLSNRDKILFAKNELADEEGISGVEEVEEILNKLENISVNIKIDFTLVRGFDYYTGPIFEIRSTKESDLGSFAGGGRYDNLVELYGGQSTPAVGISLGIERIFEILSRQNNSKSKNIIDVFVANQEGSDQDIRTIVKELRDSKLSTIYDISKKNLSKQLEYVNSVEIPYCLIINNSELKLKDMTSGEETVYSSIEEIVKRLKA